MSRAREYQAQHHAAKQIRNEAETNLTQVISARPRLEFPLTTSPYWGCFEVTAQGDLLAQRALLSPAMALEVAAWITETFGEHD